MTRITIAAVGDLLMKSEIIASAKRGDGYVFDAILQNVKPYLLKHDLTIGNLETTFSGKRRLGIVRSRPKCNCPRERIDPATRKPVFNCPDEWAPALKRSGFRILTTANNHSMDGGTAGLKRTIGVLDRHGLMHTGTYRSREESKKYLIVQVKGIRIGILNYTESTNSKPVPSSWLVNRLKLDKVIADIRQLKKKTDVVIVYLHFGREYSSFPSEKQKKRMRLLFKQGANAVIGAHPHIRHPVTIHKVTDIDGRIGNRVAASSLGNFISTRLKKNSNTIRGMILSLTLTKNRRGVTDISKVERIATRVRSNKVNGRKVFRVVPVKR